MRHQQNPVHKLNLNKKGLTNDYFQGQNNAIQASEHDSLQQRGLCGLINLVLNLFITSKHKLQVNNLNNSTYIFSCPQMHQQAFDTKTFHGNTWAEV